MATLYDIIVETFLRQYTLLFVVLDNHCTSIVQFL